MRVLVVWCPDWSVVAALREAERSPQEPAAVLAAGVVEVCNAAAREEGVRRGQRRRDAQARCPELVLLEASPDRDARHFEPVLETVEALRPGVACLRPGLLAVRAPGRWFGGEAQAAAVVAETLVEADVWDVRLGVADDLFTAEQSARRAAVQECEVVPVDGSAAYLQQLPVEVLEADGSEGREAVSLLRRLGLRSLGDLAALPLDAVQGRFGRYGAGVWHSARGEGRSHLAARQPPPDLTAEISFEPPLDSVEAICFSVRTTAERLVTDLASRQLVATGVRIEAEHDGAVASARTWLHPRYFSVRDLVDRVHWQLQGGAALRSRQDSGAVRAPVERVRFLPEVVEPASAHSDGLWGGSGAELVERGVARVQAMVGFDAVTRPVLQGGRGPADRQAAVPWGERATGLRPRERPWPGQLPGPAPSRVFAAPLVAEVRDQAGRAVAVTARGAVSGEPSRFRLDGSWQPVAAWAGPWPVDESWWVEGGRRASRFQVVGADGRAWLLTCTGDGWLVEAGYD
ncbi:DNA polymerase Y family protein [Nocardioides anomalus]|uniref:DNA polymerase Y family protein n=1 Tax=Nocardioides anomalus TaxID=2712223 RepID=A0A6G6WDE7_9ACTN|nr:DNA polymerase Y family protein [Nocardioides anomalus]QIG43173.1 DNA polymerase Y family protein [Nocardioides anomalus]